MKLKFLLLSALFGFALLQAQTPRADSLRKKIDAAANQPKKLAAILDYCDEYQSLNRDTAYDYALLAVRMAKESNDLRSEARADLAFANSYYLWGWVDSAAAVCDAALKKYKVSDARTREVYFKLMRQKALCYGGVQKFPEALDVLYQLLREAEQYNDSLTLASTCNTLGSVNINREKPEEAIRWIGRALQYDTKEAKFLPVKAAILTNAANAYMSKGRHDSAMRFINAALPLCRAAQNLNTLATALRIRSRLYVETHQYDEAEKDLREMLGIRHQLNNGGSGITDDNIQVADFYANTGQLDKAIAFCKQSIKNGDLYTTGDSVSYNTHLSTKLEFYKALAGYYKQAGRMTEYEATLEEIIAAKDSFYASNSAQAIAEVQTKYETEQKEKTILQQKYNLAKQDFIIYGSLGLLVLSGIIFYLLFREYKRRQKIKMALAMQEEQTAKKVAVKDAEERERRRIAADLHDNLGVQANAILYNTELLKNEPVQNGALVDGLHDTARQMLLNLRETLWAMKTADISAAELWLRIISFSKGMGRHYAAMQFTTKGEAPQHLQLPSAKALHIVMMVQEAVQNAVKHSDAAEVVISSDIKPDEWRITVADNGKGFAPEEAYARSDSYGLKNLRERAKGSGLVCDVESIHDQGTAICIHIPNLL